MSTRGVIAALAVSISLALAPPLAEAHPVAADGVTTEWSARTTPFSNQGVIARDATATGEYIFVDAAADERTDLSAGAAAPDVDLRRFAVTGDADSLSFLIRTTGYDAATVPQVQITIDLDRVSGSGQTFVAALGDTVVTEAARWEYLVQTTFHDATTPGAQVLNTGFAAVATGTAVRNTTGEIEIDVPWSSLGLSGPPSAPIRLSASIYRASVDGSTVPIGDATVSNALDAIGDCGDPRQTGFPNSFACDLADADLDFYADIYFEADGDVMSPLLISHAVPDASTPEPGAEWLAIRNVTSAAISTAGFKVGDEETPDPTTGVENMAAFPVGVDAVTINAGQAITLGVSGSTYNIKYGELPTIEVTGSTTAPNMTAYANWGATNLGSFNLANTGDQLLLLDASNTIIDVVNWGNASGDFSGVDAYDVGLVDDRVIVRTPATQDTDDNDVDFTSGGTSCAADSSCAGGAACNECVTNVCVAEMAGISCADGTVCNGDETCNGLGACLPGTALACTDANPCTDNSCDPVAGCMTVPTAPGASCADATVCNGAETCDGNGACVPGTAPTCDDGNLCTDDACDAVAGCTTAPRAPGTSCADDTVCNGAEVCDATGTCLAGTGLTCDDGNLCTDDACDAVSGCVATNRAPGSSCADGTVCNGAETCDGSGACVAGTALVCDDGSICTDDSCDAVTGCAHAFAAPTIVCRASTGVCDAAETCTGGSADCPSDLAIEDGTTCDDGNVCTIDTVCDDGACGGGAFALELSDADFAFGTVVVGADAPERTLTITNHGAGSIAITDIASEIPAVFPVTDPSPVTLGPDDDTTATVDFVPAQATLYTGDLTVETTECGPIVFEMSGTGEIAGFSIDPMTHGFGDVDVDAATPPAQTFTITNTGTAAFEVTAITLDDTANFTLTAPTLPASVAAAGTLELTVTASPDSEGAQTGTVTITFSGGTSTVTVTQTGVCAGCAPDAGVPDAAPPADAEPAPDAEDEVDAGENPIDPEPQGCGCSTDDSRDGAPTLLLLLLAVMIVSRSRRR
jgi:MYXO-CTERM domain-containing protein